MNLINLMMSNHQKCRVHLHLRWHSKIKTMSIISSISLMMSHHKKCRIHLHLKSQKKVNKMDKILIILQIISNLNQRIPQ
jgi:hypothetical protein